ncbi:MAG TPA: twin-arginine translocase subunit TatC [Polyangiaceae bacterium]|nr:twin-arginine translocase subunit TatC [Polyangiaceae bacterium]
MPLWSHLEELRSRLIRMLLAFVAGSIGCWLYKERILNWLILPYEIAFREINKTDQPALHFGSPAALFLAYLHLSALAGLIVALPMLLYQLWAFIAPGLYAREKRFAAPFVLSSCLLFGGGGYFGWAFASPAAFRFLLSFMSVKPVPGINSPVDPTQVNVLPTIMIGDYLDFVTRIFVAFGATAELPILAAFLAVAGLVTHRHLIQFFRYFVVIAFVISAIVTPPDLFSQILLAVPLIGLYGISIGVVWLITRARKGNPDSPTDN